MKASEIINVIKYGDNKCQLKLIYMLACVATIVAFIAYPASPAADTESYFEAGEVFFNGNIDKLRTPIYPIICHFANTLSKKYVYDIIALIQLLVFYISIWSLYRLCTELITSKFIIFVVTAFYVCAPHFFLWTTVVLSESLSLSLLIMLCYSVVMVCKKQKIKYSFSSFVMLTILLFLRPVFIFLVPILFLLWTYYALHKISALMNIALLLTTVAIFVVYGKKYEKDYGFFSTSVVSAINQFQILRKGNLIDTDVIENARVREEVKDFPLNNISEDELYRETNFLVQKYGANGLHQCVRDMIKAHPKHYIGYAVKRFIDIRDETLVRVGFESSAPIVYLCWAVPMGFIFNLSFRWFYFLIIACLYFIAMWWKRSKHFPSISLFLLSIPTANLFAAVVGAQSEYARLVLPSLPIMIVLVAVVLDNLIIKVRSKDNVILP